MRLAVVKQGWKLSSIKSLREDVITGVEKGAVQVEDDVVDRGEEGLLQRRIPRHGGYGRRTDSATPGAAGGGGGGGRIEGGDAAVVIQALCPSTRTRRRLAWRGAT